MAISRRGFLRTLGGTGLVLAAGTVGLARCDRMPESAIAPWNGPGPDVTDIREWTLSYALLAPNPHNIQPWLADLRTPGEIMLYVDPERLLPETDPYGRQILIGHGTFLELLDLAARERGYRTDVTLFPEGAAPSDAAADAITGAPVARIALIEDPSVQRSPLFGAIFERRSCKEPYDMARPLSAPHEAALKTAHIDPEIAFTTLRTGRQTETLMALTRDAITMEMETPRLLRESLELGRIGADQIAANPDGIDLHGPMFWWLKTLGLMTIEKAATPGTLAYQGGMDYALGWANATPSFGWIATEGNARAAQVQAGRAYVRINLAATLEGVSMHPVSQLLQEYEEMTELQARFLEETATPPSQTVQMLFRLGYAEAPPRSPRRPLDALLRA